MNHAATSPAPLPARRRRIVLIAGLGTLALLASVAGYYVLQSLDAERALAAAVAEADQLDPGWRLMELEANRQAVPAEQDAAPVVTRAGQQAITVLNTGTVRADLRAATEPLEQLHPATPLTAEQTATLRAALQPLAPVLTEARKVAGLPRGRFATNVKPELNWTVQNVDHANLAIWILTGDALVRIQDGDADGAWVACQAVLNTARALGDEPVEVIQLVRGANAVRAVRLLERTLAHVEAPAAPLAAMQLALQDEAQHPALLIALRANRAIADQSCTLLENGKASLAEARRLAGNTGPPGIKDEVRGFLDRPQIKPAHAWLLRYLTQAVEIAKRPESEVEPALAELEKTLADAPALARELAPKFSRMLVAPKQRRAILRCAIAALAAERYRLAHEHWPASLDELVAAKLLPAVPADPYDGRPLRLRALADGVVVYSVGHDGHGDGGMLEAPGPAANRVEFRLWNGARRGQGN